IHIEQGVATMKRKWGMKKNEQGWLLFILVQVQGELKDVASFLAAAAEEKKKRGHVLSYLTMEESKLLRNLLL
ncbi:hypothetical protein Tco_0070235, partial [Tanacetum coccineum]